MKNLTKAIIAGGLLASAATAQAEGLEVSGNVALTSDYIWRGQSQTDSSPAIQGGFDIEHESGAYAGIWGSNVDYDSNDPAVIQEDADDDSNMEVDYYFGFSNDINDNLSYDIGYVWYDYPQQGGSNNGEVYASLSFNDLTVGVFHSDDTFSPRRHEDSSSVNAPAQYYYADYSRDVAEGVSVGVHYGHVNTNDNGEDYSDWNISVSKSVAGVDLSLMFSDTNIKDDDLADDVFVFTIAKSL